MLKSEIYLEAMRCVLCSSRCSHDEIIEIIDVLFWDKKIAMLGEEQDAKKEAANA